MPIFVDCNWGKANRDLTDKYGVRGYPTVLFTDPEGNVVARMGSRAPGAILAQIESLSEEYPGGAAFLPSVQNGWMKAIKREKPLLIFFTDGGKDAAATEEAFGSKNKELARLLGSFSLVRHEIKKDCDDCKSFRVGWGSTIVMIDPRAKSPTKKPLQKVRGKKTAKELIEPLKSALKEWEKAQKKRKGEE